MRTASDLVQIVYRALVAESLVPSDPRLVARAALAAIARRTCSFAETLPSTFGANLDADAAWLAERAKDVGAPWDVLYAMAYATGAPHTRLMGPAFGGAIGALMRGEPFAAPGLLAFAQPDGRLVVFDVAPGGSAHASGVREGDVIEAIDGSRAARPNAELMALYGAHAGQTVTLDLLRGGAPVRVVMELVAGDVASVTGRMLDDGVGLLRVRWFAQSSDADRDSASMARRAIAEMVAREARGLVVDLRSSIGGSAAAAAGIVSALCDGDVVSAVRGQTGEDRLTARVGERVWPDLPIVVLVDEQAMSSAEITALALRELAQAALVGVATAGALNSPRRIALDEGYALLVPSDHIVGPRTRSAQPGDRLSVDVEVANPTPDELRRGTDPQLTAACARFAARV